MHKRTRPAAAIALTLLLGPATAGIAPPAPSALDAVMPPDAKVDGVSMGEWTSRWWRWVSAATIAPYLDPDGRICDLGQDGPVWFLAGTDGNFNPQRECVVPEGKYLLVPIINMVYQAVDAADTRSCADLQAEAAVNNDHLVSAVVLLDEKPVPEVAHYRVRSDGCFVIGHDENGADLHAAADGYWLMLKPLSPGRHTLTIGANYGSPETTYGHMLQNFEYVLHIGPPTILSRNEDPRPEPILRRSGF